MNTAAHVVHRPFQPTILKRLAVLGLAVLFAVLIVGCQAMGTPRTVTVPLAPVGDSGVSGTATLSAEGDGTRVSLDVSGLEPGASAESSVHAGSCASPSASAATLPELIADSTGKATASGQVLFRGTENVALSTLADGEHVIAVSLPGGMIACGTISS